MEIMKLNQFLNEAKIYLPIVDIVIDNDGNIYDGKTVNDGDVKHRKLIKGGVDWKNVKNPIPINTFCIFISLFPI